MNFRKMLGATALMAVLGLASHQPAVASVPAAPTRKVSDVVRDSNSGAGRAYRRAPGLPPKDWGMSQRCARMVRHSKLTRLGWSASKI